MHTKTLFRKQKLARPHSGGHTFEEVFAALWV